MLLFAGQCSLPLEDDKETMSLGLRKKSIEIFLVSVIYYHYADRAEITGENLLWITVRSVISLEKSGAFISLLQICVKDLGIGDTCR